MDGELWSHDHKRVACSLAVGNCFLLATLAQDADVIALRSLGYHAPKGLWSREDRTMLLLLYGEEQVRTASSSSCLT